MLTKEQLYVQNTMPEWNDISLGLYKEFAIKCLFPKMFRYYLDNEQIVDVQFKEWAMKHLWAIHHIDSRIDKDKLFEEIDNGLSISHFRWFTDIVGLWKILSIKFTVRWGTN